MPRKRYVCGEELDLDLLDGVNEGSEPSKEKEQFEGEVDEKSARSF